MLATLAEFPHPGSIAWLRGSGDKVRILENDGQRDPLIAYQEPLSDGPHTPPSPRATTRGASGNTRLPLATLAASRDEALKPAHPEEAVRPSRRTAQPRAPRRSAR